MDIPQKSFLTYNVLHQQLSLTHALIPFHEQPMKLFVYLAKQSFLKEVFPPRSHFSHWCFPKIGQSKSIFLPHYGCFNKINVSHYFLLRLFWLFPHFPYLFLNSHSFNFLLFSLYTHKYSYGFGEWQIHQSCLKFFRIGMLGRARSHCFTIFSGNILWSNSSMNKHKRM